jgi:hypothetical protein
VWDVRTTALHLELEADLAGYRARMIAEGNAALAAEKVSLAEAAATEIASIRHQNRVARDEAKEEEAQLGREAVRRSS